MFLNRGPSYIPPCQLQILLETKLTKQEIVKKQMKPLTNELTKLFTNYPIDFVHKLNFDKELELLSNECFIPSIPTAIKQRAVYEKHVITSIRHEFNVNQLILRRTADNCNVYVLDDISEFDTRSQTFFEQNIYYEYIGKINIKHTQTYYVNDIIQSLNSQFKYLYEQKFIDKDELNKFLLVHTNQYKLPYLYFLPNSNEQNEISYEPQLSSYSQSPIYTLSEYLYHIIAPFFETVVASTRILNTHHFLTNLDFFCCQSMCFNRNTYFVIYKIVDFYNNISHSILLRTLKTFLIHRNKQQQNCKLSNETILQLVQIVLLNNFYVYHGNIYRSFRGCSINLRLYDLLCDIYLYDWQRTLVQHVRIHNSFYKRIRTQGFICSNGPIEQVKIVLEEMKRALDSDIPMEYQIGKSVAFLNISIENLDGHLNTNVYRHPNVQRFLLPYVSGHPSLIYRQWFEHMLMNAILYCSQYDDFQDERLYIELTLLANGYSNEYVQSHMGQFYRRLCASFASDASIMNMNQHAYMQFRRRLSGLVEKNKYSITKHHGIGMPSHPLVQLHYLYDWGLPRKFNKKFQQLWKTILHRDPQFKSNEILVQLYAKHCFSSNTLLTFT